MQARVVWMHVPGHRPGSARAASPPKPGSQKTDLDSRFVGPGWRECNAHTRMSKRVHKVGSRGPGCQIQAWLPRDENRP
jgi:hypothetical protein